MKTRQPKMEQKIIKQLCSEDVIIYIANRHKIEPETLIIGFLKGDRHEPPTLLENEREILRGLMNEKTQYYEKV